MGVHARGKEQKQQRRQIILTAARPIFFEKGFMATAMSEIAKAAKLAKGTLYLYFQNKEELYISLLVEGLAHLNQAFKEAVTGKTGWETKVRSLGWAYYRYSIDYNEYFHIAFQFQHGKLTAKIADDFYQECFRQAQACLSHLSRAIAEGIEAGDIREQDPMSLAMVLWGSLTGIIFLHESKDHRELMPFPISELVEKNIEIAVGGLKCM